MLKLKHLARTLRFREWMADAERRRADGPNVPITRGPAQEPREPKKDKVS